jgi:hypothetical protein
VRGHVYFSARQVAADPARAMRRVVEDHYPTRARVPRGPHHHTEKAPGFPGAFQLGLRLGLSSVPQRASRDGSAFDRTTQSGPGDMTLS